LIIGSLFHFNKELELVLLYPERFAYLELSLIIINARKLAYQR
jgi:hypothetical protein